MRSERAINISPAAREFQGGDGDFFVISLRADGFDLNLTAAEYVAICDPWWNRAAEDRTVSRTYRMGQRRRLPKRRPGVQGLGVPDPPIHVVRGSRAMFDPEQGFRQVVAYETERLAVSGNSLFALRRAIREPPQPYRTIPGEAVGARCAHQPPDP